MEVERGTLSPPRRRGRLQIAFSKIGNLSHAYSPAGAAAPTSRFAYDGLSHLTKFMDGPTGAAIETYGYDATGNRTSLTTSAGTTAYTYPADSHRLAADP